MQNGTNEDRIVDDSGRAFTMREHRFPANGTGFLLAPVVWFAYFIAVYGLQGAGCAAGLDQTRLLGIGVLQLLLLLVTVAAVVLIVLSGLWSYRAWQRLREGPEDEHRETNENATFLACAALLNAALFLIATLWIGAPILLVDSCDMLGSP